MLIRSTIVASALALLSVGCTGSPSAPTATLSPAVPAPAPTPGSGERWNLTVVFGAVTGGPAACVSSYTKYLGLSYDWLLEIQRSGQSMILIYDVSNVAEGLTQYAGTAVGDQFTAARATGNGNLRLFCSGGQAFDARSDSQVSGRFSADGRTLTATEVGSLRLASGETLTFRSDWTASRQ